VGGSVNSEVFVERGVVFGRSRHLVGVISPPARRDGTAPGILFINSGIIHRVGANRIYVRLARALAAHGAATLRFDLSGIGDSNQPADQLDGTRNEIAQRDILDALAMLQAEGAGPLIVAGLCSGADDSLTAIARYPTVRGAVLLDPHAFRTARYFWAYYGPKLVRPSAWWSAITGQSKAVATLARDAGARLARLSSPTAATVANEYGSPSRAQYLAMLQGLLGRGASLLYVFTGGLPERYAYEEQFFDAFHGYDLRRRVTLEYMPTADHIFTGEAIQQRLERVVVGWYESSFGPSPTSSPVPHACSPPAA
jgi:dienelactone hydrolase